MTLDTDTCHPYIGGGQQAADSTSSRDLVNPATGDHVATVVDCDADDVDTAVRAAVAAQRIWVGWNRMAQRVEAGTIWGNTMRLHHPALAFGGFKDSGVGGAYADGAIEGSTRVRRVSIRFDKSVRAPGWDDLGV